MSDTEVASRLTVEERERVDQLIAQLNDATGYVMREAKHMERVRIHLGFGALAVTGIAFIGMCIASTATDFIVAGFQVVMFAYMAFLNLRGPHRGKGGQR